MDIKCERCGAAMILKDETRLKKTYVCSKVDCTHQIKLDTDLLLALKMGESTFANVHLFPYADDVDGGPKQS